MSPRLRSIVALSLLAAAWVCASIALGDPGGAAQAPHQPEEVNVFKWLLSGSGNAAALAVFLWGKLTSQDREIAAIKTANEELKKLMASRPCVYGDEGDCDALGKPHRRRKGDA